MDEETKKRFDESIKTLQSRHKDLDTNILPVDLETPESNKPELETPEQPAAVNHHKDMMLIVRELQNISRELKTLNHSLRRK